MTRRIALAILISACTTMIVAGLAAYFVVRQVILRELDEQLVERATNVMRTTGVVSAAAQPVVPSGDRYLVRADDGRTIARPAQAQPAPERPVVVSRGFASTAQDGRLRTLTLRWNPTGAATGATIVYSSPARIYDASLAALAGTLAVVVAAGVVITSLVARRVAARATRPLVDTASAIGEIDETKLSRRIEAAALPPELAPVAARLNEMLERLETSMAQRQRFMIDAAHELRSPVAALRTTIEVAMEKPSDPTLVSRTLTRCLASVRVLDRLVALLSETLRGAAGSETTIAPVNPGRVVCECARLLASAAEEKGQRLKVDCAEDPPIECDADKLRSIAINLIANAIEYAPPGGLIEVTAGMVAGGRWRLAVRDDGPGIAPEHQRRVFDPFFRVDASRGRGSSHLGLGLYLVQSHARSLGGECLLHSEPGAGATFTVTFPASPAGSDDDAKPAERLRGAASSSLQERVV